MFRLLCLVLLVSSCPVRVVAELVPLGTETQINVHTTGGQGLPSIATASDGAFVVTWTGSGQGGDGYDVVNRRFDSAAQPLGGEAIVNTFTTSDQFPSQVASRADGSFVVVWSSYDQDGSDTGVFGQRYDSSGSPAGTEFQVNTYTTGHQRFPSVASSDDGSVCVVWMDAGQDGDGSGIFGQRYDSVGAPAGTEFQVNTYTTSGQYLPRVAATASGQCIVVWESWQDGDVTGIYGQRFDETGAPLGTEFQINSYTTNYQQRPTVARAIDDSFVVVWSSSYQDGMSGGIFGKRYDSAGSATGTEFQVNSYTSGNQTYPSVAIGSDGTFLIAWSGTGHDGSATDVFGQHFDSGGQMSGSEMQINTYTTSFQIFPSVAAGTAGQFVVAWQSRDQDGDYTGVFAQRLEPGVGPPPSACPATPGGGCAAVGKAQLQLKLNSDDTKNKLKLKLKGGPELQQSDFGDPTSTTSYALCVYDDSALRVQVEVAPHGTRWSAVGDKGFKYDDPSGSSDGVNKMKLLGGPAGRAKMSMKGKGAAIPMPTPISGTRFFAQATGVTVQLRELNEQCYTATFTDAVTKKNDGVQYKAKY